MRARRPAAAAVWQGYAPLSRGFGSARRPHRAARRRTGVVARRRRLACVLRRPERHRPEDAARRAARGRARPSGDCLVHGGRREPLVEPGEVAAARGIRREGRRDLAFSGPPTGRRARDAGDARHRCPRRLLLSLPPSARARRHRADHGDRGRGGHRLDLRGHARGDRAAHPRLHGADRDASPQPPGSPAPHVAGSVWPLPRRGARARDAEGVRPVEGPGRDDPGSD